MLTSAMTVAALPQQGDYFKYDYNTHVGKGAGYYDGYTDTTRSHSHYSITSVNGDIVTVHGTGSWTFDASDGTQDSGILDISFNYSSVTRRYLDLVDVEGSYVDPSVWFWIPSNVNKGETVRILEDMFTVVSTDKTLWIGMVPHKVVVLEASGSYTRDDAYGLFSATYHDVYCFDRGTGFIVSESYTEDDVSTSGSFRFTADLKVTSSSYSAPIDWFTLLAVYLAIPAIVILIPLLLWRRRRGPSRFQVNTLGGATEVEVKRMRRVVEIDVLTPGGSRYFTPFLRVFARRAIEERDPVIVAYSGQGLMGMAMLDRESHLGSVFALDEQVARVLLRRVRMDDFFLEVDGSNWDLSPAQRIDTFDILELRNPEPVAYDALHVRAMKHEDIPNVVAIAQEVYKGPASRWVTTCYEGGDVAFVAVDGDRVVGFGFATVVGTDARLHTLTISLSHRASGLGSEIMAARLSVLATLGVERVIVEISKHNDASMTVARKAGFSRIGETAYYSRRPLVSEAATQRRF